MYTNLFAFIIFGGLLLFAYAFVSKRKQLLATLLRLEGLILLVFFLLGYSRSRLIGLRRFILVFLTLVACEGALGLSVLISIVRRHGRDYFNSLNSLIC